MTLLPPDLRNRYLDEKNWDCPVLDKEIRQHAQIPEGCQYAALELPNGEIAIFTHYGP